MITTTLPCSVSLGKLMSISEIPNCFLCHSLQFPSFKLRQMTSLLLKVHFVIYHFGFAFQPFPLSCIFSTILQIFLHVSRLDSYFNFLLKASIQTPHRNQVFYPLNSPWTLSLFISLSLSKFMLYHV